MSLIYFFQKKRNKIISFFVLFLFLFSFLVTSINDAQAVAIENDIFMDSLGAFGAFGDAAAIATPGLPVTDVGAKVQAKTKEVKESIFKKIEKILGISADVMFKNALRSFLNRVAYDTAVYISTGGKGQKPLFVTNFSKFLDETAGGAIGDYLNETVGKRWGKDLCAPLSPLVKLNIQIRARQILEPPAPRCRLSQIYGQLKDLRNFRDYVDWTSLQDMFTTSGSELGALFSITTGAQQAAYLDVQTKQFEKITQGEVEPLRSKITGDIKTPGFLVERAAGKALVDESYEGLKIQTGSPAADAIGTFFNTLTYKLLQKVFKQGFNPQADVSYTNQAGLWGSGIGTAAASLKYNDLIKPNYNSGGEYDILQRLVTCDVSSSEYSIDPTYCVIDEGFRIAVAENKTLEQAIAEGNIDGKRTFGAFRTGGGINATPNSSPDIYSLRSIKILRKYRIVPVGWELAAEFIAKYRSVLEKHALGATFGQEVTLNDLIADYNNAESPFYHLVDPNWVLKAPKVNSVRKGASAKYEIAPQAVPGSVIYNRLTLDVDEQTCLFEDNDGNCKKWGYCSEERPIWRFRGAEECDVRYATCQNYLRADNSTVAYLEGNLDFDSCAYDDAVGCRAYCNRYNTVQGAWQCVNNERQRGLVYLNCGVPAEHPGETHAWSSSGFSNVTRDCVCYNPLNSSDICKINEEGFGCTTPLGYFCTLGTYNPLTTPGAVAIQENSNLIFANNKTQECSRADAGCHEFLQLRKAGDNSLYAVSDVATLETFVNSTVAVAANTKEAYSIGHSVSPVFLNGTRQSCERDEIGCAFYTPVSYQGPRLPGQYTSRVCNTGGSICADTDVTTWNDECPAQCVGFKTYRQEPANFEPAWDPVNFVLKTPPVNLCSASEEGCDQFTNLDEVARGGEGIENFKYVRQCQKPGAACETYYTWVGSDTSGYQLKEYSLVRGAGGPATVATPVTTLGSCTGAADAMTNPHCKEFYDRSGVVSYRIFENTISCSEDCHPYRWTMYDANHDGNTNGADCTTAGGTVTGAECIFQVIPDQGERCTQAGCREYKGNAGNNIRVVLNYDFELPGQYLDWDEVDESLEATYRGGHSIRIASTATAEVYNAGSRPLNWFNGQSYEISFWAKAESGTPSLDVETSAGFNFGSVNLSVDWQLYKLGPLIINRDTFTDETLQFDNGGTVSIFMDNIVVTETTQSLYLIRESWDKTIAASCTTPTPFFNCEAYNDKYNNRVNLYRLSKICREEAVGCEALVDTHNSESIHAENFNYDPAVPTTLTLHSVRVPQDNVVFVVNDPAKTCATKGCEKLGLTTIDRNNKYTFQTVYKILNPDDYKNSLCTMSQEMCQEYYRDGDKSSVANFKDPLDKVCEWRNKEIVSFCTNTTGHRGHCEDYPEIRCATNADCITGGGGGTCIANYCGSDADCYAPGETVVAGACSAQTSQETGWFIKNTKIPCERFNLSYPAVPIVGFCQAKNPITLQTVLNNNTHCFAKSCPAELSTCAEYRDPRDPEDCRFRCRFAYQPNGDPVLYYDDNCSISPPASNPTAVGTPGCQSYFELSNSVTGGDCTNVDPRKGCVPFYDPNLKQPDTYSKCMPGCRYQENASGVPTYYNDDCQAVLPTADPEALPGCVR